MKSIRTLVSRPVGDAGDAMQKSVAARSDRPASNGPECPLCGGTGWKAVGRGTDRLVARCDCSLQYRARLLLKSSNIPARYAECDFQGYVTGANSSLAAARLVVQKWASQYPLDRRGLLLIGPSGVGKTHLAVAAMKQLMNKSVHCLFCDYRELLKQIQNSYNPSVQATELEVLRPIFETEVVVLDDIGAVKPSEWVWDTVSIILNTRYNSAQTTIITSNFEDGKARKLGMSAAEAAATDDTLGDRVGERMRSRLFEMCRLVQIDGEDYRQKFRNSAIR